MNNHPEDKNIWLQSSGKIILLGEHAVLQGAPGIALPLRGAMRARALPNETGLIRLFPPVDDVRMEAVLDWIRHRLNPDGFDFFWESRIPAGAGLGASAALSCLLARWALTLKHPREATMERIHGAAHEMENIFHGHASGIDDAAACRESPVLFQKPRVAIAWPFLHEPLTEFLWRIDFSIHAFLAVGYSGESASTREMVRRVQERDDGRLAVRTQELVETAVRALKDENLPALGQTLDAAHELLAARGASTKTLDRMVRLARNAGALGAKLTGSGGGGCVLALAPDGETAKSLAQVWERSGFRAVMTLPLSSSPPNATGNP